jgi:hypothetical protein
MQGASVLPKEFFFRDEFSRCSLPKDFMIDPILLNLEKML